MRIGIDAHMLGQQETGNETYILELVRAFAAYETGDIFHVYVERADVLPRQVREARHVRVIEYSTRSRWQRLLRELPRHAARHRLDVLHLSYNAPLRTPPACALVITIHDISYELYPEWFPRRVRTLLKFSVPRSAHAAARILTDTEAAKHDLVRYYKLAPEKIHVTPYAANERFTPLEDPNTLAAIRAKYNTSEHFVLAVGNMQPRKNWERLLRAFGRARREYSLPHKLVIVGQRLWLADGVFEQARELGDVVVLTGYIPDDDLPLLYNAADVFCYPSLYEGFGLPVLEAMASGAPVITSNLSALPEVAGGAARLVNPYAEDELARAMGEVLTDEAYRANLKLMGLARASQFSWERTAQLTLDVYYQASHDS